MYLFSSFLVGLRLAVRARFLLLVFISFFILSLAVYLASQFSGRQPASVALDVGFSVMRLFLPFLVVFLVQSVVSKDFDGRYYLSAFSYSCSRSSVLLGRYFLIVFLICLVLLVMSLLLGLVVSLIGSGYVQATPVALGHYYAISIAFFSLDLLVLASLATFLAVVASTPSFVLIGTFGFMLVARSYGAIVDLLSRDAGLVGNAEGYRVGLGLISYLLPDLGSLDMRMLAIYGKSEFFPADWLWLLLSNSAYAIAFLALAIWALQRKRFA